MININFHYAYLALDIPFIIAWILIFIFSKSTRKEQLTMSLLFLPTGTISELLYFQDYWNPASILSANIGPIHFLFEDFIFSFAIMGIGVVIFNIIFKRLKYELLKPVNGAFFFILQAVIAVLMSLILFFFFGINSIFATSFGFLSSAILILILRKDLIFNSIMSGILMASLMFACYLSLIYLVANTENLLRQGWLIYGTPLDIRIFHVPLTEIIWGFAFGMFIGPLYEFISGKTAKSEGLAKF